jgi:hypothetical protein
MFKVTIAAKDVAEVESLTEACQVFVRKVQEMMKAGGCSAQVVYEGCWISATMRGIKAMMNFDAVRTFANEVGLVKKGVLLDIPAPYLSKEIEEGVFLAAFNNSLEAYLVEHENAFLKAVETVARS